MCMHTFLRSYSKNEYNLNALNKIAKDFEYNTFFTAFKDYTITTWLNT